MTRLVIMCLLPLFSLFQLMFAYPSMQWPASHCEECSALLQFKDSFNINRYASQVSFAYPKVASWKLEGNGSDCCSWDGVECDDNTGYVIGLNLSASCLYGSINSSSSLFRLFHLQKLDLSFNDFSGSKIPSALGNLSELTHLQLSNSLFFGQIPSEISKLSKLSKMDLSYSYSQYSDRLLKLKMPDLKSLVQNRTNLEYFVLASVDISSPIPDVLANFSLRGLNLLNCGLYGKLPMSVFHHADLEFINLSWNNLKDTLDLDPFLDLKKLATLHLSFNNFALHSKPNTNRTVPMLQTLGLASCSLSAFPHFLRKTDNLRWLDLSLNDISGKIPSWIWKMSTETLEFLDLSHNFLTGLDQPPAVLPWSHLRILGLGSNILQGSIPIPPFSTIHYSISNNSLTGEIPKLICKVSSLEVLDLSKNHLNGSIPQCLGNFSSSMSIFNLERNNLSGTIPQTWANGSRLRMISLGHNKLQGHIPTWIASCKMLEILDLSNNQINDTFPSWMGTLAELMILILRINRFHGKIGSPESSLSFPKLQILDISSNYFTGNLPVEYFQRWYAMQVDGEDRLKYMHADTTVSILGEWLLCHFDYSMTMTNKGLKMDYEKILEIFIAVDLSCNKFEGEIPEFIGNLKGLRLLNLSNNILSGFIPSSIGNLAKLEALDMSQNKLSGEIPRQIVQLTFLEFFNVSHNHLKGPIPCGNQFNTFQSSSFDGNSGLCGVPLSRKCGNVDALPSPAPTPAGEPLGLDWKFVVIGYGSGFVFGAVMGHIVVKRKLDWFMKTFRIRQERSQRHTRRRRGN